MRAGLFVCVRLAGCRGDECGAFSGVTLRVWMLDMAKAKIRIEDQNSLQAEPLERGLNLAPLALVIDRVWVRWARLEARRATARLGEALALICARVEREPVRQAEQLAARKMARLDRHRIKALRDGEDAPALSAAELKVLAAADRLEASAAEVRSVKGRPATRIRAEAGRMRTLISREVSCRGEARRADLRLAQTIELDAAREGLAADQVLEAKRGQTGKRLKTRDGLKMLHESGALTPKDGRSPMAARIEADRLLSVGLRYRDRYEMAQASLRSCLAVADGVKVSSTLWTQAKSAQRRAALANQVRVLDVAVATRLHPDALLALRMVAGEARTVRSITSARRRRIRLAEGLVLALTVVGDILSETR